MPAQFEPMMAAAGAAALAALAWVVGRLALRRLRIAPADAPAGVAAAVGLAVLAQAALALAFVDLLRAPLLAVLAAAALVAGRREWAAAPELLARLRGAPRGLLLAGGALVAAATVMAAYPPAAFDEVVYHLPMARAYAASGGLEVLPQLRFPVFPALAEVLQAALLPFGGDRATHGASLVATVATGLLLLAYPVSGRLAQETGWLAAAAWAGSPIVVYLAGTGYVEPLLALWSTAALLAVDRWRRGEGAGWCALAAAFAGCAAATKYLGLLTVAFVAAEVMVVGWARARRELGVFVVVAALVAAPTYVRLWWLTGNPTFPFYSGVFGSSEWDADELLGSRGVERVASLGTHLWDVVARRERTGHLPPFTPLLPAYGALALAVAVAGRGAARRAALFAFAFLLLAPVHAHYLVMVLPALALAGAAAVRWLRTGAPRRLAAAAALALVAPGPLYAAAWVWRFGPPPASEAARERYLAEQIPLLPALRAVERRAGAGYVAYALWGESLRYHARGTLVGEVAGPHRYHLLLARAGDPAAVAATMRGLGVSYLILPVGSSAAFGVGSPAWEERFGLVFADGHGSVYEVRE